MLSSAFLGLTIASLPFIIREERSTLAGRLQYLVFTLIGITVVVGLSALREAGFGGTLSLLDLQLWQSPYLFLVGALAITAMVLPGISGSTLLLVFGAYMPAVSYTHLDVYKRQLRLCHCSAVPSAAGLCALQYLRRHSRLAARIPVADLPVCADFLHAECVQPDVYKRQRR